MKNYTIEEQQAAKRIAYKWLFSQSNIILNKEFKYDARTRIGNLAAAYVKQWGLSYEQKIEIKNKQRARSSKFLTFRNIKNNPIVLDYLRNKAYVKHINPQRIHFSNGRNHWAKTDQDAKILSVLMKYHEK